MSEWLSYLTDDRPAIHDNQVTLTDVRPGVRFVWHYPHLPNDGSRLRHVCEITGYSDESGRCPASGPGIPLGAIHLQDAGIIPYPNRKWNTNWLERVDD